jgi:4'-phosphopantetheinyl transferase
MNGTPGLDLPSGEIHLWEIDLDRPCEIDSLSRDEQTRAARFHFERDRRRYIHGRSALRQLLGRYLNQDPTSIAFTYGPAGKPSLPAISFNLAHSGPRGLIGFARNCHLGVDIEEIRALPDIADVAKSVFSPGELFRWRILPATEQLVAFYRIWTRKEAYLKAIGEGIAQRLQTFEVAFEFDHEPAILGGAEGTWTLVDASDEPNLCAAIAYDGRPLTLKRFPASPV